MLAIGIVALIFFTVEWIGKLILIAIIIPFVILIANVQSKKKLPNKTSLDKSKSINSNSPESTVPTVKKTTNPVTALSMLVFGGLVFMIAFKYLVSIVNGGNVQPTTSDNSTMAFVQCKTFVKERLKAPSTADFPILDRESINMGDHTYVIRSYVDSQNSFGAMIRNKTFCKVKWNGTEDADIRNWKLIELEMSE